MSYDIYLVDKDSKVVIEFEEDLEVRGGTYAIGGLNEAWLNVTYNYCGFFCDHIDQNRGIRFLYGKTGAEAIPILEKAIKELEALPQEDTENYWDSTPGNAAKALRGLLKFAQSRPDGIFTGD